jgi:toxin ParE1/3/4
VRHYRVRHAAGITGDLDLIESSLFEAYRSLGDDSESAAQLAAERIGEANACMRTFETYPHRGTEHPDIREGLRTITSNRFIFYFDIDDTLLEVRRLAVFFGGLDHRRQIADRIKPH